MEIKLFRLSSKYCFMNGKLFSGVEFIADALEFNNEKSLKKGTYELKIVREFESSVKMICICQGSDKIISRFVKENITFVKNIAVREKNSFIQIGLFVNPISLVMYSYIINMLIKMIEKANERDEPAILTVLNELSDNFDEEKVTAH